MPKVIKNLRTYNNFLLKNKKYTDEQRRRLTNVRRHDTSRLGNFVVTRSRHSRGRAAR